MGQCNQGCERDLSTEDEEKRVGDVRKGLEQAEKGDGTSLGASVKCAQPSYHLDFRSLASPEQPKNKCVCVCFLSLGL